LLALGFREPHLRPFLALNSAVAAGWALIPDQSRLTFERRNPHHLFHYGFASRTWIAALRKVCHATRPLALGFELPPPSDNPPVCDRSWALPAADKKDAEINASAIRDFLARQT
jgi:hypothetical protein